MTTTPASHPSNTTVTKDPICGMVVDPKTALHAEHAGKTSYFCSAACRTTFVDQQSGKTTDTKDAKAESSKGSGTKATDHGKGCC